MTTKTSAIVAQSLTSEELTALLRNAGFSDKPSGETLPRLKLDGNMLVASDTGEMWVYNPTKPTIPAVTVRLVKPPEEYWAMFIGDAAARAFGRPELGGFFSKRYVHPDPDRRVWDADMAFDELKNAGLTDDYGKIIKPSWKADVLLQIVPESGQMKGDEQTYILTLNTTSLIEFKGVSKNPEGGVVSEKNFIRKLSEYALTNAGTTDPKRAVLDALTSLTLGGVVAEVRLVRAENKEKGQTWTVIVFDPIHVEPMQEGDALLTGGDDGLDDIPD